MNTNWITASFAGVAINERNCRDAFTHSQPSVPAARNAAISAGSSQGASTASASSKACTAPALSTISQHPPLPSLAREPAKSCGAARPPISPKTRSSATLSSASSERHRPSFRLLSPLAGVSGSDRSRPRWFQRCFARSDPPSAPAPRAATRAPNKRGRRMIALVVS